MKKIKVDEQLVNSIGMAIGFLAMLCLLAYNWQHTGGLLGKHIQPRAFGYVAAAGIELSVVWLSFKLGRLKRHKDAQGRAQSIWRTRFSWALLMTVAVSMAANLSEGFQVRYGMELTGVNFLQVSKLQFFFTVLATLLISVIVFTLSDVVSNDAKVTVQIEKAKDKLEANRESEAKSVSNSAIETVKVQPIVVPEPVKVTSKQLFEEYVEQYPQASYRELIRNVDGIQHVSEVKRQAAAWGWHKNGNGWEKVK